MIIIYIRELTASNETTDFFAFVFLADGRYREGGWASRVLVGMRYSPPQGVGTD
jgi:hypothetical protein